MFLKNLFFKFSQSGIPLSLVFYLILGYIFILFGQDDNGVVPWIVHHLGVRADQIKTYKDVSKVFGQTVITSGVATSLLRTNFFSDILQKQLFKVVYTENLLKDRRDIIEIWSRVSKVLYSNKFPDIADKLNDTITRRYFPIEKHYYYFKSETSLKIEVIDKSTKLIEVLETVKGVIKMHRTMMQKFNPIDKSSRVTLKGSIGLKDENDTKTAVKVSNCFFNGKTVSPEFENKKEKQKYRYNICFDLNQIAEDSIDFEYTIKKTYHMLDDVDFINRVCDNIHFDTSLYVNYKPSDLKVWFTDLGTADDYKDLNPNGSEGLISKTYTGVMFPGQGFSLLLKI